MTKNYLSICLTLLLIVSVLATKAQDVFINEIHYDNAGGDEDEGIEIAGPAGTDLAGWSLVLYNGSNGLEYETITLAGVLADQQGGRGTLFFAAVGLQNGSPDGIVLLDPSNGIVQFLSYEGTFSAANGPAMGLVSEDIGVSEPSSAPLGTSMQLTGQGSVYTDFTWQTGLEATYNAVNVGQSFGPAVVTPPLVNEFVFNHTGVDSNEFVEVLGDPNQDYSNYSLLEIEGDGAAAGTVDEVISVGITNASGYWATPLSGNTFENGTVTLLLVENFTGSLDNDLDTDNDGVFDITPWDRIVDDIAVNDGGSDDRNYGVTLLQGFDGSSFTVGGASRIPNGTDSDSPSDWTRNDFGGEGLPAFPGAVADAGEAINTYLADNTVATGPVADILVNELDADTEGRDAAEFIELFDGGMGNTSLDGLVLVFFNGSNNLSYRTIDLGGFMTDADGYFVLGNPGVPNVALEFPGDVLQNGADAVALYAADAADFPNGSAVTTMNLVDALVYDTNDPDDAELLVLLNAGEAQVNEAANGNKDFESLQRIPNGSGGARNTSSYVAAAPTPGAANGVIDLVTIAEARNAAIGESVTVRGVLTVTSSFAGPAYIQDATGGIAVFDSQLQANPALQVGDSVEITAVRDNFNDQVQLEGITNLVDLGAAINPIQPLPITLDQLSSHPGELVSLSNVTFPAPGDLFFGNSNYQISGMGGTGELRIDNDVADLVGKAQPVSCPTVVGVVGRFRDIFQLLPRGFDDLPCAEVFVPSGDDLSIPKTATFDIVTWNIEWFGDEDNSPAAGDPNSDAIQKDSVKSVLLELDADVVAVQEITDVALFDALVSELPGYDYFLSDFVSRPNDPGAKQRIGFIYKTSTVQPDTLESQVLLASIHPLYNGGDDSALVGYPAATDRFWASGRLPYLMVADVTIEGITKRLHIVDIHARANSSRDAQQRYDMRKYDVEVLKDTLDTFYPAVDLVLLGDYNDDLDFTVADIPSTVSSYEEYVADTANYNPLTLSLSEAGFRTFVFRENVIDHIAVSNEFSDEFIIGSARVGYEFYDNDYSRTASDHLPVSARFRFMPEVSFNTSKAIAVASFEQGKRRNGRPVVWWRSNPKKALGRPLENFYFNFVSLGFGGEIVLELDVNLYDLEGNDFRVFESTFGPLNIPCHFYPETAEVSVSQEGDAFVSLGTTCLDRSFDLADAGVKFAKYIKITDTSDPWDFSRNADGFDLDGIWPINPKGSAQGRSGTLEDHENYAPNEEGEMEITVYPNPFEDKLQLDVMFEDDNEKTLRLYNVMGVVVFEERISAAPGQWSMTSDFSHLPGGMYVLKITGAGEQVANTMKLIKR